MKTTKNNFEKDSTEIDLKRKLVEDPLSKMNQNDSDKKEKKKKKSKKINSKIEVGNDSLKKKKTIEELRAERLKRENEEKIKAQRLVNGGLRAPVVPSVELDDRKRRYNSQFNPDLARF